jgi:murein DD-endopeptidase MepM/ murein hydrolase activator NlpD
MEVKLNKKSPGRLKTVIAVLALAAVLFPAGPVSARLDELIQGNAPYITPPVVEVAVAQRMYEVKTGDTLTGIARLNGITIEMLVAANRLKDRDQIRAGQLLKVPSNYITHHVQPGETLWDISRIYRVDLAAIAARNGKTNVDRILAGQRLIIPCSTPGPEWTTSRGFSISPLAWPLVGTITSPFGMRDGRAHEGVDVAAEEGIPIRAAASGRVVFAGSRGTYGLAVIIDHGGGVSTLYAHCSRVMVAEGSSVDTSTVIALAGNTGNSRGPHLHLEVLKNGVPVDPLTVLEQERYYG